MSIEARLADKNKEEVRRVRVKFGSRSLRLIDSDKSFEARWRYEHIQMRSAPVEARSGRVAVTTAPDTRLFVKDMKSWKRLEKKMKKHMPKRIHPAVSMMTLIVFFAMIVTMVFMVCYTVDPSLTEPVMKLLPTEWQEVMASERDAFFSALEPFKI